MIGDNIRKRREELNMSQEELAKKLGYRSRSSVNKIELNLQDIPQKKIIQFAEALNTTVSFLMDWDDETYEEVHKNYFSFGSTIPPWYSLSNLSKGNLHENTYNLIGKIYQNYADDENIIELCGQLSHYASLIERLMNSYVFTDDEKHTHIEYDFPKGVVLYYNLNDEGQELANEYIEMLSKNSKYVLPEECPGDNDIIKSAYRFQEKK